MIDIIGQNGADVLAD